MGGAAAVPGEQKMGSLWWPKIRLGAKTLLQLSIEVFLGDSEAVKWQPRKQQSVEALQEINRSAFV